MKHAFSTVTLAPALDITLTCRKFPEPGDVITGFSEIETPGGKGLNAARWLAMRGHPVVASGIIGAEDIARRADGPLRHRRRALPRAGRTAAT